MEKKYYIFGETAVRAYDDGDDDVVEQIATGGTLYVFDPSTQTPADLMADYDGWQGYIEITEEEYNDFNAQLEVMNEGA